MSVLRAGAHECQIRFAPVLVLPRLQRFSITPKGQRAKIKIILTLCQQSKASVMGAFIFTFSSLLKTLQRLLQRG
ncbi:hypothetical protein C6X99_12870 [Bacillus pumilus]|nr:hypothetical protein C6X99_12870 [Bacillus pumilus]